MVVQEFNPANVMLSEKKDGSFTPEMTGTVMKEVRDHSLVMRLGKYEEMNGRQEKKFSFQTDGVSATGWMKVRKFRRLNLALLKQLCVRRSLV